MIPKSWEWLIVNYIVNVVGGVLLVFYIFKSEKPRHDYIKLCKLGTCMAMEKKDG
jgi:hypothetical protein